MYCTLFCLFPSSGYCFSTIACISVWDCLVQFFAHYQPQSTRVKALQGHRLCWSVFPDSTSVPGAKYVFNNYLLNKENKIFISKVMIGDRKENRGYQELGRGWSKELLFNETEFQFEMVKRFWRWTVAMVAQQHERTECHWTEHLKMAKRVNFILCNFTTKKVIWL